MEISKRKGRVPTRKAGSKRTEADAKPLRAAAEIRLPEKQARKEPKRSRNPSGRPRKSGCRKSGREKSRSGRENPAAGKAPKQPRTPPVAAKSRRRHPTPQPPVDNRHPAARPTPSLIPDIHSNPRVLPQNPGITRLSTRCRHRRRKVMHKKTEPAASGFRVLIQCNSNASISKILTSFWPSWRIQPASSNSANFRLIVSGVVPR